MNLTTTSILSRVWAWSESCSLASSVATNLQLKEVPLVKDSLYGNGSFSLQLNAQANDDRMIQNVIQFYNDSLQVNGAPFVVWNVVLSDMNGQIPLVYSPNFGGAFSSEVLPWPPILNGGDILVFGLSIDGERKLIASLLLAGQIFRQVSKAPFAAYQTEGFKSLNFAVVGTGGGSSATFQAGSFEILSTLGDVGDLAYDGTGYPLYEQSVIPTICGKQPAQTLENSNLKYQVLEKSNASIRMVASL